MKYKPTTDNSFNSLLDAKLASDRPLWDQGRSAAVAMSVRMGDSNTILEAQLGSAGRSELATIANAARTAAKAAVPEPSIEAVVEGFRNAAQHQADSMHQFMLDTALGRGRLNQTMFNSLAERLRGQLSAEVIALSLEIRAEIMTARAQSELARASAEAAVTSSRAASRSSYASMVSATSAALALLLAAISLLRSCQLSPPNAEPESKVGVASPVHHGNTLTSFIVE